MRCGALGRGENASVAVDAGSQISFVIMLLAGAAALVVVALFFIAPFMLYGIFSRLGRIIELLEGQNKLISERPTPAPEVADNRTLRPPVRPI